MQMETLVVVSQHRNQYYSRGKAHGPGRFEASSSPSRNFREINCRTFQAGAGILPTPLRSSTTPVTKHQALCASPKSPSICHSDDNTHLKTTAKSSSLPIDIKPCQFERFSGDEFSYSELWAGPAYSNSPPPSSLPIPRFSVKPKRTVSLDLPISASDDDIKLRQFAKSAPPSPTREPHPKPRDFFVSADFATKTLRRILNLDVADE